MIFVFLQHLILCSSSAIAMNANVQSLLDKEIIAHKVKAADGWRRVQDVERAVTDISPIVSRVAEAARPMSTQLNEINDEWLPKVENRETFTTVYENKQWKQRAFERLHQVCCRAKNDPAFYESLVQEREQRTRSQKKE